MAVDGVCNNGFVHDDGKGFVFPKVFLFSSFPFITALTQSIYNTIHAAFHKQRIVKKWNVSTGIQKLNTMTTIHISIEMLHIRLREFFKVDFLFDFKFLLILPGTIKLQCIYLKQHWARESSQCQMLLIILGMELALLVQ